MTIENRALIRCMGGRFCQHTPGTCTAMASAPTITETETVADFVPCERTVRHLMASMPDAAYGSHDWRRGVKDCLTEMEAMLPKKGRAEELVRAFHEFDDQDNSSSFSLPTRMVRFLIAQGEIRG